MRNLFTNFSPRVGTWSERDLSVVGIRPFLLALLRWLISAFRLGDKIPCSYTLQLECMLPIIPQRKEGDISEGLLLFLFHMLYHLPTLGAIYLENTNSRGCMWKLESLTGPIAKIYDSGILVSFIDWCLGQLLTGLTQHLTLHSPHLWTVKNI